MKQPELGKKIVDLRKAKGLTQEELADRCQVNVRSVQRIENGEVAPRLFTLRHLSEALDFDFNEDSEKEDKIWLMVLHLSNIIPVIIAPLIIWIWKRDEIPGMDSHGRDVLNFQISMCIYLFCSAFLVIILIGVPILIGLGLFIFTVSIINTIHVAMGEAYRYPLTIRFVK